MGEAEKTTTVDSVVSNEANKIADLLGDITDKKDITPEIRQQVYNVLLNGKGDYSPCLKDKIDDYIITYKSLMNYLGLEEKEVETKNKIINATEEELKKLKDEISGVFICSAGTAPTPEPAPKPAPAPTSYKVVKGDTLWGIVKKHYLLEANRDIANKINEVMKAQTNKKMVKRIFGNDMKKFWSEDGGRNLWEGDTIILPQKKAD